MFIYTSAIVFLNYVSSLLTVLRHENVISGFYVTLVRYKLILGNIEEPHVFSIMLISYFTYLYILDSVCV